MGKSLKYQDPVQYLTLKSCRVTVDLSDHLQSPEFLGNVYFNSTLGVVRSLGHDLVLVSNGEKRLVWIVL